MKRLDSKVFPADLLPPKAHTSEYEQCLERLRRVGIIIHDVDAANLYCPDCMLTGGAHKRSCKRSEGK